MSSVVTVVTVVIPIWAQLLQRAQQLGAFCECDQAPATLLTGVKKQNKVVMMPWWSINVVCQEQVPEAMAPPQQTLFPLFRSPGEAPSDLLGTARSVFISFELTVSFCHPFLGTSLCFLLLTLHFASLALVHDKQLAFSFLVAAQL